jgi:hypothetical protein
MKQIVKLTKEKTDSVHVDDVDVSKGIKATDRDHHGVAFVFKSEPGYYIRWTCSHGTSFNFDSLSEMVSSLDCSFFTLDGRRITTERELTVDDLQNTDHIGFVIEDGRKGEIVGLPALVELDDLAFIGIIRGDSKSYGPNHCISPKLHKSAKSVITEASWPVCKVYLFTGDNAAKELYAWLAE